MRASLPDRPGTLALLARSCGDAEVNILRLQIFPGLDVVTDELVLSTPPAWGPREVTWLIEAAGGDRVEVSPGTEAALSDQPTRYVQAAREIVESPMRFPEIVGRLFDAESSAADPAERPAHYDVMEVMVGDMVMQIRRGSPFTATEHARGAALADLVSDVLRRTAEHPGAAARPTDGRRLGLGVVPDYVVDGTAVSAIVEGVVVGRATMLPGEDPLVRDVSLRVDPAWQRRGIGTRLLGDVSRLAHAGGGEEIVLTTEPGNQAILPMVMAAGLRGRLRLSENVLTVRVPVGSLRPFPS